MKRGLSLLVVILLVLSIGIVVAQENNNDSEFSGFDDGEVGDDFVDDSEDVVEEDEETLQEDEEGVEICHIPPGNPENARTINVGESAVESHFAHGDYFGECETGGIDLEEIEEEEGDVGEIIDAGATPDSIFYFLDEFFDRFGDDLEIREEKIAEIKVMIEEGNIEAAREALKGYKKRVQKLKDEIGPDKRREARRSAIRIKKALKVIEKNLDEDDKKDFVDDILEEEENILTAVEISHKIRELCSELHELGAWDEFERVCRTDDDGPRWQKDFFESLTEEQIEEAEKFGKIMSSCLRTSGEECDCAGIPHEGMAAMCFEAAPLARACDGPEHDEEACDRLDNLDFPEDLPRHLEEVMFRIEQEYGEDNYDNHIPRACLDAGVTGEDRGDRKKCFEIMIESEAPPECRDALKEANVDNERDARRICEKIMFEINAPEECIDAGIDDPRKCAEFFEDEFVGGVEFGRRGPDRGPDCRGIEDSKERLRCYDGAERHYDEKFEDRRGPNSGPPGGWPGPCREAKAFSRESCEKIMRAEGDKRFEEIKREERACAQKCSSEGKAWDFSYGCSCRGGREDYREYDDFYEDRDHEDFDDYEYGQIEDYNDFPDDFNGDFPDEFNDFPDDFNGEFNDDVTYSEEEDFGNDFGESGNFDSGFDGESGGDFGSDSSDGDSGSSDGGDDSGGGEITGAVIYKDYDNAFLDYFFGR